MYDFLQVGGCKLIFSILKTFFFEKSDDFCWEKLKIFKTWGGAHPPLPHPVKATSLFVLMFIKMNPAFSIFHFNIYPTRNIFLKQAVVEIHYLEALFIAKNTSTDDNKRKLCLNR